MILKGYLFGVLYAFLCIGISLLAYKLGMPKKYTRKLVHIFVGFEWVILSHYHGASFHFLIVCLFFLVVLALSHFLKLMPMMSSDSENAPGTVYYAVAMSIMAVICLFEPRMLLPFGIGVFCTSFGDGLAGVVGQLITKGNPKVYGDKTLFGMIANLIFSLGSALLLSHFYSMGLNFWQCLLIALLSVGLEVITGFGFDNITTTLGTAFLAYAFMYIPAVDNLIVPIILTPVVIAAVNSRKILTRSALFAAIVLDIVVSLTLGNFGFVLLLSFLALSVIADKIKKLRKKDDDITARSSEMRDIIQVLANGLVPGIFALMFSITLDNIFIVGYIAALAEALADTVASGIGVFSKTTFDLFKMKKCEQGISGGMSVIGTLGSVLGAFVIGLIALAFGVVNLPLMLIAVGAAFLGAVFDSMLGSLVQVKFKCTVCGKITEKGIHCSKPTVKHSGFYFFDNDIVNLFSGAFSAILATVICALI